jgi:hypothetical protein
MLKPATTPAPPWIRIVSPGFRCARCPRWPRAVSVMAAVPAWPRRVGFLANDRGLDFRVGSFDASAGHSKHGVPNGKIGDTASVRRVRSPSSANVRGSDGSSRALPNRRRPEGHGATCDRERWRPDHRWATSPMFRARRRRTGLLLHQLLLADAKTAPMPIIDEQNRAPVPALKLKQRRRSLLLHGGTVADAKMAPTPIASESKRAPVRVGKKNEE